MRGSLHCRPIGLGIVLLIIFLDQRALTHRIKKDYSFSRNDVNFAYEVKKKYQHCSCGVSNMNTTTLKTNTPRIVGGEITSPNAYPWMVLINGNNTPACGGALISDQYVVTAAHCTQLRYRQEELKVVVGEHNFCTADNQTAAFSVQKMIVHPMFDGRDYSYDIMLLKLNMKILFNDVVRPICLPLWVLPQVGSVNIPEEEATILGWGFRVLNSRRRSCELQQTQVRIIPRSKCLMTTHYNTEDLPITLFCAGVPDGSRDSCQGDSGGPLQVRNKCGRSELIGIISNGISCGNPNFPGIYTNVPLLTAWIIVNTQDSIYCTD